MYKQLSLAATAVVLLAALPTDNVTKKEMAKMAGRWVAAAVEHGGNKLPLGALGEKQTWHFAGDRLTRYNGLKKENVVRIEIQPDENPKRIDFVPIKGDEGTSDDLVPRMKGIYLFDGDAFKIAMNFEPPAGSPEQEKQRNLELAKKRPTSFDTNRSNIIVITLRRDNTQPVDDTATRAMRKWTDRSGKQAVDAELISVEDEKVRLRRADGKEFTVPLEKLSEADQEFIRARKPEPPADK